MPSLSPKRSKKKFLEEMRLNAQLAKPGPHPFVVVLDHLKPTFNVGKIFRSAQAFGAEAVYLVGMEYFNPFPAQGALRYVPTRQFSEMSDCLALLREQGFQLIAFDVGEHAQNLMSFRLPPKSALILGHEAFGFSYSQGAMGDVQYVKIPMFAQIESLNVSVAASIVMYEYVRQFQTTAR